MMFDIVEALYYIIPAAALIFFAVSLFLYHYARHKNKRAPGTYSESQIKVRRICLFISSAIAGVLVIIVLAFIGLMMMAVAFM